MPCKFVLLILVKRNWQTNKELTLWERNWASICDSYCQHKGFRPLFSKADVSAASTDFTDTNLHLD